ncbi:MAG: DUF3618 domain-containing protein, partial [Vicinamibacterales bacterium]
MDQQNPSIDPVDPEYSAPSTLDAPAEERTREIRAEIEQTREDMSETVNAIQERLRPSTLASDAASSVKQAAIEKARDVADSDSVMYVRANPIPTAMVGVGIAGLVWLAARSGNGSSLNRSYSRRRMVPSADGSRLYEPSRPSSGRQSAA